MTAPLTPNKTREKQKWQIALRRYVIEKHPNPFYAPYFGLDVAYFRRWIECQFTNGLSWNNFGSSWQFEFAIPLTFFNFQDESDLKLAWNYLNIRVGLPSSKDDHPRSDLLFAKNYFTALSQHTSLPICRDFLARIESLEAEQVLPVAQILEHLKLPAAELTTPDGRFLRLWPHRHHTDGFYAAAWVKS